MYDADSLVGDGRIESPNLTKTQKNYAEILSQFAKLANYVAMRNTSFWVERPDGYNSMIAAIQKDSKNWDTMKKEEREKYERKYRYEKISSQRLGGAQILLQHMIYEAHQDEEIKKLWKSLLDESKMIASKEASDYLEGKDEPDLK